MNVNTRKKKVYVYTEILGFTLRAEKGLLFGVTSPRMQGAVSAERLVGLSASGAVRDDTKRTGAFGTMVERVALTFWPRKVWPTESS